MIDESDANVDDLMEAQMTLQMMMMMPMRIEEMKLRVHESC